MAHGYATRRVLTLLLLLLTGAALAQDEAKTKTKLPFEPYGKASVDDWAVYCTEVTGKQSDAGAAKTRRYVENYTLGQAEDGFWLGHGVTDSPKKDPFGKARLVPKTDVTLEKYLDFSSYESVKDAKTEDAKLKVSGKEFACKKVSFKRTGGAGREEPYELWFAPEVKAGGLVKLVSTTHGFHTEQVIAGFGHAEKTEWGEKVKDAMARFLAPRDK